MTRIVPLELDELPDDLRERLVKYRKDSGFVPTLSRVLGRKPGISRAYVRFRNALEEQMTVPSYLRQMMFHIMSVSAGCLYCQAHSIRFSKVWGGDVAMEKVEALWEFETSPLFDDAERAALRFAQAAGHVPNAVTDEDFDELRKHYSEDQILEMVAALAFGAMLNKFNDTLATTLEDEPREFAERVIGPGGWQGGKHVA